VWLARLARLEWLVCLALLVERILEVVLYEEGIELVGEFWGFKGLLELYYWWRLGFSLCLQGLLLQVERRHLGLGACLERLLPVFLLNLQLRY